MPLEWYKLADHQHLNHSELIMAFAKETIRNEVLLRFGEVGEQRDKLIGALQRSLEQVLEDGVIISSKALDPEQLSALPGQSGTPLADVLGEVTAATIIENQTLTATLASIQQQFTEAMAAADAQIADLTARLEQALAALAAAQTPEPAAVEPEAPPAE